MTHPNDLVAGTPATFKLMLDGKPAPDLQVTVIAGGNRYRDKLGEMSLTTDQDGKFSVNWPAPGMYWMEAVVRDDKTPVKGSSSAAPPMSRRSKCCHPDDFRFGLRPCGACWFRSICRQRCSCRRPVPWSATWAGPPWVRPGRSKWWRSQRSRAELGESDDRTRSFRDHGADEHVDRGQ